MISIKSFITDLFFPISIITLTIIAYNLNIQALNDISFYLLSFGGFYAIIKGFSKKLSIKQVFLTTDNKLISGHIKLIYPRNKYLQYFLYVIAEPNIYTDIAYYNQDEIPSVPKSLSSFSETHKQAKSELKDTEYKVTDVFTEHNMYV